MTDAAVDRIAAELVALVEAARATLKAELLEAIAAERAHATAALATFAATPPAPALDPPPPADPPAIAVTLEDRILTFAIGEASTAVTLPFPIDRGVWREGATYDPGDVVTWGGALWICQAPTLARPRSDFHSWRLAVKGPRRVDRPEDR